MPDNKVQIIVELIKRGEDVLRDIKSQLGDVEPAAKSAAGSLDGIGSSAISVGNIFKAVFGIAIVAEIKKASSAVLNFMGDIETAQLGIASSYMTAGKYIDQTSGKALSAGESLKAAQQDSKRTVEELQVANFQTIATLDQLVRAYSETLPVAMAKGFDRQMVKDFTVATVQAAGAIGLSLDMLAEETRSLLTGTINPRTSRIGVALGLTNEDIRQHSANAKQLFDFLMEKLAAYQIAGIESQNTWKGLWSNVKDIALQVGGQALQPLFDQIKSELMLISNSILTINEKTKRIEWNPEFLKGIHDFRDGLTEVIAQVYRLGMFLDKVGGTLSTIGRIGAQIIFSDKLQTQMLGYNKMFEDRYNTSLRQMEALAHKQFGLRPVTDADIAAAQKSGKGLKTWQDPESGNMYIKDQGGPSSKYVQNPEKPPKGEKGKDYYSQNLAAEKEYYSALLSIEKSGYALIEAEYEDQHARGLMSDKDFYENQRLLLVAKIQSELALLNKEGDMMYAEYSKRWDKAKTDSERNALTKKYEADALQLEAKKTDIVNKGAADRLKIDRKETDESNKIKLQEVKLQAELSKMDIEQGLAAELDGIKKQEEANKQAFDLKLISATEYQTKALALLDQETAAKKKALDAQFQLFIDEKTAEIDALKDPKEQEKAYGELYKAAKKYYGDTAALTRDSANERLKIEQNAAAEQTALFNETFNTIENAIAKAFERPKEALADLGRYFLSQLEKMAAQALANPIIIPITQMLTGGSGGLSQQQIADMASTGQISGDQAYNMAKGDQAYNMAKGGPGLLSGLSQYAPLIAPATAAMSGNWAGAAGGVAGFALSGALGTAIGTVVPSAVFSAMGPALSTALFSAVPVIGTLIGMALGSLLGGLFEDKPDYGEIGMSYDPNGVKQPGDTYLKNGIWVGNNNEGKNYAKGNYASGINISDNGWPLTDAQMKTITKNFKQIGENVYDSLNSVGLDLSGFTKTWSEQIDLEGLDKDAAAAKIKTWIGDFVTTVSGIKFEEFSTGSEDIIETITRLMGAISSIGKSRTRDINEIYDSIDLHPNTLGEAVTKDLSKVSEGLAKLPENAGEDWGNALTQISSDIAAASKDIYAYLTFIKQAREQVATDVGDILEAGRVDRFTSDSQKFSYFLGKFKDGIDNLVKNSDASKVGNLWQDYKTNLGNLYNALKEFRDRIAGLGQSAKDLLNDISMQNMTPEQQISYVNRNIQTLWSSSADYQNQYNAAKAAGDKEGMATAAAALTDIGNQLMTWINKGMGIEGVDLKRSFPGLDTILGTISSWSDMGVGDLNSGINSLGTSVTNIGTFVDTKLAAAITGLEAQVGVVQEALAKIDWSPLYALSDAAGQAADSLKGITPGVRVSPDYEPDSSFVPSYDVGIDYVGQRHKAYIDPGEAVLTASGNRGIATILSEIKNMKSQGVQPIVMVNVNVDANGIVTKSVDVTMATLREMGMEGGN